MTKCRENSCYKDPICNTITASGNKCHAILDGYSQLIYRI